MQRPITHGMVPCTQDEWADRMSDVRTYQTEEQFRNGYSVMYSRVVNKPNAGDIVGEVHYLPNGEREYFTRTV